ncbi:hypothetical protein [Ferrimonas marina]|uniref:Uncharacterized protein n=1 Tax=Ferrimonas marina TaxID=299255 RepID=A0A1M5TPN7_9GAMM|nr:hypothetical protein [Ferrimonas marina]SHH52648.1 hypothetical protein SAMN02745129_2228 [Ferrimonas marina]
MPLVDLKADVSSDVHGIRSKETLFIRGDRKEVRMTVEPAYRFNGTQNHDGYFPRTYKRAQDAKAAATRYFGVGLEWVENVGGECDHPGVI